MMIDDITDGVLYTFLPLLWIKFSNCKTSQLTHTLSTKGFYQFVNLVQIDKTSDYQFP